MSNFRYSFEVISDDNRGTVYKLNRAAIVIGSSPEADITIQHDSVADNHCLIKQSQGRLTVLDMHSGVGSKVGNRKIESETVLNSGDILTIGTVRLRVLSSTFKERLGAFLPAKQAGNQSLFKKISGGFKREKKSTYEKVTVKSLLLMVGLGCLILIYPLYSSFNTQLDTSKIERSTALLKTLATVNIEAMRTANQAMVNTSMVAQERGVGMAIILTNEGVVWAPESLLDQKAADTYGKNAVSAERLLVQKRADGMLDLAMPIKYYDFNKGSSIKVGVARIIYDMKAPATAGGINWFVLLLLSSGVYLLIALLTSIRIIKTVKQDIHQYREDCEEFIRNDDDVLGEKYSSEFNGLTVTINRMLRKMEQEDAASGPGLGSGSRDTLLDLVKFLDQGALLLDKMNIVLCCNAGALELLGLDNFTAENRSLLEIPCQKEFYKDILELISRVSQSSSRESKTFALSENDEMTCVAIPVEDNLILLLFNLPKPSQP